MYKHVVNIVKQRLCGTLIHMGIPLLIDKM